MKRSIQIDVPDTPIEWRKTGGGSFFLCREGQKNLRIKPGQKFSARPSDIPAAFRDTVIPVHPEELKAAPVVESVTAFEIQAAKAGYYNVVNVASGKQMNEKGLRKDAAEKLLESLS